MSFRKSRQSVDLRRASLPKLQKCLAEAMRRVASAEKALANLEEEAVCIEASAAKLKEIESSLARLRTVRAPKPGVFGKLFRFNEIPPELRAEIAHLERLRDETLSKHPALAPILGRTTREQRMPECIAAAREHVEQSRSWVCKLESALERRKKRNERIVELRAAAAANVDESRRVGSSVRRKLHKQADCPYCGGQLGTAPQLDHIYPVSKGGRSVPKNMVFACASCNQSKKEMTVAGFCKKYSLDRSTIEERLSQLGKEY